MTATTVSEETTERTNDEESTDTDTAPDIEADLVSEKLKIDGICGVY